MIALLSLLRARCVGCIWGGVDAGWHACVVSGGITLLV